MYYGDYLKGAVVFVPFNARAADGSSIALATNGTPKAFINGGTTEITTGLALVENHDGIEGRHGVTVDTSGSGFTVGADVAVAIDGSVVDGKTVNAWLGVFSIGRTNALATAAALATVAGYLDTEIAAIKAKTDLLPSSPAAVGSEVALNSAARLTLIVALIRAMHGLDGWKIEKDVDNSQFKITIPGVGVVTSNATFDADSPAATSVG